MLSNMLKHRSAAGVTVLDGEIYACGGHDGLSIFDSVSVRLLRLSSSVMLEVK